MIVEDLSTLRPGQEVRVTYRGIVQDDTFARTDELAVQGTEGVGAPFYHYHKRGDVTVELVEPEYEHFGVYRDAKGNVFLFDRWYHKREGADGWAAADSGAWFSPGVLTPYAFEEPTRPLTKLVPEAPDAPQLG